MSSRKPVIRVTRQWLDLLNGAVDRSGRTMIVGPVDCGKSTLATWLGVRLSQDARTASVDADVGQSRIGPPGSIGWRLEGAGEQHYFVGDVTPAQRVAAALSCLVRAVEECERLGAQHIVIDTTGYVDGDAALELKVAKAELLAPIAVAVIGDSRPVRRIAAALGDLRGVDIIRLQTADTIRTKSPAWRRQYRADRFAEALAGSNMRWIDLHGLAIRGTADGPGGEDQTGLLVGFQDTEHRLLCVGVLKSVDRANGRILVQAPELAERASGVVFGAIRIDSDGRQIE